MKKYDLIQERIKFLVWSFSKEEPWRGPWYKFAAICREQLNFDLKNNQMITIPIVSSGIAQSSSANNNWQQQAGAIIPNNKMMGICVTSNTSGSSYTIGLI